MCKQFIPPPRDERERVDAPDLGVSYTHNHTHTYFLTYTIAYKLENSSKDIRVRVLVCKSQWLREDYTWEKNDDGEYNSENAHRGQRAGWQDYKETVSAYYSLYWIYSFNITCRSLCLYNFLICLSVYPCNCLYIEHHIKNIGIAILLHLNSIWIDFDIFKQDNNINTQLFL